MTHALQNAQCTRSEDASNIMPLLRDLRFDDSEIKGDQGYLDGVYQWRRADDRGCLISRLMAQTVHMNGRPKDGVCIDQRG